MLISGYINSPEYIYTHASKYFSFLCVIVVGKSGYRCEWIPSKTIENVKNKNLATLLNLGILYTWFQQNLLLRIYVSYRQGQE